MIRKFKLTKNKKEWCGRVLYQIKALRDGRFFKKGELGGWVEKEDNLSQDGDAWVSDNALVFSNALVYGNAQVFDNARVFDNALVYDNARVFDNALVYGNAQVFDNALVYGNAQVYGHAWVYGRLKLSLGFYFGMQYKKEKINKLKTKDGNYILWKE